MAHTHARTHAHSTPHQHHRAARGVCLDAARFLVDEAGVNPQAPAHHAHARDGNAATPLSKAESSLSEMIASSETPGGAYHGTLMGCYLP